MNINISRILESQVDEIVAYVTQTRIELFPMLDPKQQPKDLHYFKETYLFSETGGFWQARDNDDKLIGVIGMIPYDYRFEELDYPKCRIVEVARLYVEPAYRRLGLGSMLFNHLLQEAYNINLDYLYLHTHPFLTGAYEFWCRQGFILKKEIYKDGFHTLHMDQNLNNNKELEHKLSNLHEQ
ncbi:GNAT family N-acetyltransferase [Flavobacterium sp. '19STA2R22 D10 B1']|uniref:GNAT family N-acetyltransferase n=1 Tax=Flavobacterium aerium TaxID=3037261 RepID=UPI00278BF9D7|nr:GNAT family N-acetyltransferase [Flavobacterium sp. '19STA2R22 D10 B1']